MVYKYFDKKTGSGINLNEEQVEELHKPVIKKLKRRNVYARLKDNMWATDLAKMGTSYIIVIYVIYLLCVIDVFTKYA